MVGSFLGTWFVKITGAFVWLFGCRPKIYHEDPSIKSTKIKGKAILAPNHLVIYDMATIMFTFWRRTPRVGAAELMFEKNGFMTFFLRLIGAIRVNRKPNDFSFLKKFLAILDKGGVVEVFPEARLSKEGEETPLPFTTSAVYLAMTSGAPIIPIYHNGKFVAKERARVMVGKPIYVQDLCDENLTKKENIRKITNDLREKIIELQNELNKRIEAEKGKKA